MNEPEITTPLTKTFQRLKELAVETGLLHAATWYRSEQAKRRLLSGRPLSPVRKTDVDED